MYTRTYNDKGQIIIPDRYGGTSFSQGGSLGSQKSEETAGANNPWEEVHKKCEDEDEESVSASAFPIKLPFIDFLSNIFKSNSFGLQNIGKEEILLIATAAFLFFSKEGDKECAVMLILLLFLN